jgi:hypothetical protein
MGKNRRKDFNGTSVNKQNKYSKYISNIKNLTFVKSLLTKKSIFIKEELIFGIGYAPYLLKNYHINKSSVNTLSKYKDDVKGICLETLCRLKIDFNIVFEKQPQNKINAIKYSIKNNNPVLITISKELYREVFSLQDKSTTNFIGFTFIKVDLLRRIGAITSDTNELIYFKEEELNSLFSKQISSYGDNEYIISFLPNKSIDIERASIKALCDLVMIAKDFRWIDSYGLVNPYANMEMKNDKFFQNEILTEKLNFYSEYFKFIEEVNRNRYIKNNRISISYRILKVLRKAINDENLDYWSSILDLEKKIYNNLQESLVEIL